MQEPEFKVGAMRIKQVGDSFTVETYVMNVTPEYETFMILFKRRKLVARYFWRPVSSRKVRTAYSNEFSEFGFPDIFPTLEAAMNYIRLKQNPPEKVITYHYPKFNRHD